MQLLLQMLLIHILALVLLAVLTALQHTSYLYLCVFSLPTFMGAGIIVYFFRCVEDSVWEGAHTVFLNESRRPWFLFILSHPTSNSSALSVGSLFERDPEYHSHHHHPAPSHSIAHLDSHWASPPGILFKWKSDHVTLLLPVLHWLSISFMHHKSPSSYKSHPDVPPPLLCSPYHSSLTCSLQPQTASSAASRLTFGQPIPSPQASFVC